MYEKMVTLNVNNESNIRVITIADPDHETMGGEIVQTSRTRKRHRSENLLQNKIAGVVLIAAGIMCAALDPMQGGNGLIVFGTLGITLLVTKKQWVF